MKNFIISTIVLVYYIICVLFYQILYTILFFGRAYPLSQPLTEARPLLVNPARKLTGGMGEVALVISWQCCAAHLHMVIGQGGTGVVQAVPVCLLWQSAPHGI